MYGTTGTGGVGGSVAMGHEGSPTGVNDDAAARAQASSQNRTRQRVILVFLKTVIFIISGTISGFINGVVDHHYDDIGWKQVGGMTGIGCGFGIVGGWFGEAVLYGLGKLGEKCCSTLCADGSTSRTQEECCRVAGKVTCMGTVGSMARVIGKIIPTIIAGLAAATSDDTYEKKPIFHRRDWGIGAGAGALAAVVEWGLEAGCTR